MGQMTTPKPLIITIWTCQDMMVGMSMELIWSLDVIWQDFGSKVGQITAYFCHAPTTNLTQHNPHGPDVHPKTIDYHHRNITIDDGMDKHGIDCLYECHLVGFWLKSWANHRLIFVTPQPQIWLSTTHID
jgi:hypothetical protein